MESIDEPVADYATEVARTLDEGGMQTSEYLAKESGFYSGSLHRSERPHDILEQIERGEIPFLELKVEPRNGINWGCVRVNPDYTVEPVACDRDGEAARNWETNVGRYLEQRDFPVRLGGEQPDVPEPGTRISLPEKDREVIEEKDREVIEEEDREVLAGEDSDHKYST